MTAGVLLALPIALMLALMAVAPDYLKSMANDPDGKWLIVAAVVAQGLGFYTIRRIINVKI
jgi:Flp pilus assembly protein TadB